MQLDERTLELEELHSEEEWNKLLLDDPVLLGVQALTEPGATLRLSLKTKAGEMFRRIKNAFDEVEIEMGVPHRTVGESRAGAAGTDVSRTLQRPEHG